MTLQNRVTPTGEIVADPARCTLTGNRGILHDENRHLGAARWRHAHWICCRLSFKGRQRAVMAPGRWTELFFLDEATALAAGHRPCAECRREDYLRFRDLWRQAVGPGDAKAGVIDRALHRARIEPRSRHQIRFEADLDDVPDGTFVLLSDPQQPYLVADDRLYPWHFQGYGPPRPRLSLRATVVTPAPTVAVLRAGYPVATPPQRVPPPGARATIHG